MQNSEAALEPERNSERLQKHLKPETLSSLLVQAHLDSRGDRDALKRIVTERLEQVRQDLGSKN